MVDDAIARGFLQEDQGKVSFTDEFVERYVGSGPTVA